MLRPGGRLVLLVPALPALYGTLDIALHHFRRYDKAGLAKLVTDSGFDVKEIRFLNRPGVFGWWLNSRVLRRTVLPKGQLSAFKWLMPFLKREETNPPSFGMSLLVLGRATVGRGSGSGARASGERLHRERHAYKRTARRYTRRAAVVFPEPRDPVPSPVLA